MRTAFTLLGTILRNPRVLKRVLPSVGEQKREYLKRIYGLEQGLPSVDLLEIAPGLHETVTPYSALEGGSSPIDLALLRSLARQIKARRGYCSYFEIGTWRGESVANIAQIADRCVTLSLPDEEMLGRGWSEAIRRAHGTFSRNLDKVQHIFGDSRVTSHDVLKERFDLIFVDGDHSYDAVVADTRNVFTLLRDEHSVIVWHDYGRTPESYRWDVMAAILDGSPKSAHRSIYHVSNTLCAVYSQAELKHSSHTFPATPTTVFNVCIEATRL